MLSSRHESDHKHPHPSPDIIVLPYFFFILFSSLQYKYIKKNLIIIISILGMNLFGCKFCEEKEDGKECDRKNFDTLLWSLVTVFQVSDFDNSDKTKK